MDDTGDAIRPDGWHGALTRALDGLARACMAGAGVLLVALIAIFGWLVFGRYVLNDTPTWVEQVALLIVVWVTFIGAAVGVWRGTHLSIDFVREAMPARARDSLRLTTDAGLVVFGGVMAWQGWILSASLARRVMPMIGISESWRAMPVALSGALIVLFAGARLAIALTSRHDKAA